MFERRSVYEAQEKEQWAWVRRGDIFGDGSALLNGKLSALEDKPFAIPQDCVNAAGACRILILHV